MGRELAARPSSCPLAPGQGPDTLVEVPPNRLTVPLLAICTVLPACATTHTSRRARLEADPRLAQTGDCQEEIVEELASGTEGRVGAKCMAERERARQRHSAGHFGFIRQRRASLRGVTLLLGEGIRCRKLPLRAPDFAVLTERRVRDSGCYTRDFDGSLRLYGVRGDGEVVRIGYLVAQGGKLALRYADIDAQARASGWLDGLDAFKAIELGDEGWAGTIDLERLRLFLGNWHFDWIERGRGSAGLFAAAHPEHTRAEDAQALAFEQTLARQERDYLDVAEGDLSPEAFLARYIWSPYRASVETLRRGGPTPSADARAGVEPADEDAASPAGPQD